MRRGAAALSIGAILSLLVAQPSAAQEACGRSVVFALPGVTWEQVQEVDPPNLSEVIDQGAIGSMSVRTNSSFTSYASGFATIGAGTRLDVPSGRAQPFGGQTGGSGRLRVQGLDAIDELAEEQGYTLAVPGALGEALARIDGEGAAAIGNSDLGLDPPTPLGTLRPAVLAAMDAQGVVRNAATGSDLLSSDPDAPFGVRTDPAAIEAALSEPLAKSCGVTVIDQGDLIRADVASALADDPSTLNKARADALLAADALLGDVLDQLDLAQDLLLVIAPTSPLWEDEVHFGVALAAGPGFEAGGTLGSPSTRRSGMVTLPDVAPTVLERAGVARPATMLGRPMYADATSSPVERVAASVELDEESVFIDEVRTPVSTGFVLFQLLVYAVAIWTVVRRGPSEGPRRWRVWLQRAALFLAAFPLSTYLAGVIEGHELGLWPYAGLLVVLTLGVVIAASFVARDALDRLLIVVSLTFAMLVVDLLVGAPLQLNTVFSYSPLVAGRFAGIGNIGFAILSATSLLTGALIVHRWGAGRRSLTVVAILFIITVVVDGAPQYGSDVGGAIALVPGLGIAWLLLAGRRIKPLALIVAFVAGAVVLALFLALDLSRPEDSQTHLARLYQDVRDGGAQVFQDAITRKVRTNLRVLGSTIWTFLVPPALGLLSWLLLRPSWKWLSQTYPKVRAGLIGGLVMAVLGYAVNDSGIVIPAMMFSYLVPVAVSPLAAARGSARKVA